MITHERCTEHTDNIFPLIFCLVTFFVQGSLCESGLSFIINIMTSVFGLSTRKDANHNKK